MRYAICALLVSLAASGCGNAHLDEMAGEPVQDIQWAPLQDVESEVMMGAGYPLERNDAAGARRHLRSPSAKTAVDNFVSAELPPEFSGRADAKAEADAKLKTLIEKAAGSGSNEELKAAYDEAAAALKKLRSGG